MQIKIAMEALLTRITKQQNQFLLEAIARDYSIDLAHLKQMYHTPTFYKILSDKKYYSIIFSNKDKNDS